MCERGGARGRRREHKEPDTDDEHGVTALEPPPWHPRALPAPATAQPATPDGAGARVAAPGLAALLSVAQEPVGLAALLSAAQGENRGLAAARPQTARPCAQTRDVRHRDRGKG
jgi:hypothetical protein